MSLEVAENFCGQHPLIGSQVKIMHLSFKPLWHTIFLDLLLHENTLTFIDLTVQCMTVQILDLLNKYFSSIQVH